MALIELGPLVSNIAGSIGGATYQRYKNGHIVRTKPNPILRRGEFTNSPRSRMQEAARDWQTLSIPDQGSFRTWANAQVWLDKFGNVTTLAPFNAYIMLNMNAVQTGIGAVTNAGAVVAITAIATFKATLDWATSGLDVSWTSGAIPGSEIWILECSPPLSPGIDNPREAYRVIEVFDAAQTSPQDVTAAFEARYPQHNQLPGKYFLRMTPYVKANAAKGVPVITNVIQA